MKNIIIVICLLLVTSCNTTKVNNNKKLKNGYVSYRMSLPSLDTIKEETIKAFIDAFKEDTSVISKEQLKNVDSLYKKYLEKPIKEIKKSEANKEVHNYYFLNDTIKISIPNVKTVYIPNEYKKFTERTFRGKVYKTETSLKDMYKRFNPEYDIKVIKNDTKKILGIKGYKMIITEKTVRLGDVLIVNVNEIYVSDKYKFPFNYYDFLELKQSFNLTGLILECKTYDKDSPNLYNVFTLNDYNTKKQDKLLIKIDTSQYKKP